MIVRCGDEPALKSAFWQDRLLCAFACIGLRQHYEQKLPHHRPDLGSILERVMHLDGEVINERH